MQKKQLIDYFFKYLFISKIVCDFMKRKRSLLLLIDQNYTGLGRNWVQKSYQTLISCSVISMREVFSRSVNRAIYHLLDGKT